MLKVSLKLLSIIFITMLIACNSNDQNLKNNSDSNVDSATTVKFVPFNNVDELRSKLSLIGIGELGKWREDGMGGYMSITPYYEFGDESKPNNIALYLESDNSSTIKTLKMVLNIYNNDSKNAISEFIDVIDKTYKVLGLETDTKILNELKHGKELKAESENYKCETIKVKSNIETWKFIVETK